MTTASVHYGEDHPRPPDDRLPMILVLLDGLGDRAHELLADASPGVSGVSAVARTASARPRTRPSSTSLLGAASAAFTCHWGGDVRRPVNSPTGRSSAFMRFRFPVARFLKRSAVDSTQNRARCCYLRRFVLRSSTPMVEYGSRVESGAMSRRSRRALLDKVRHYETPTHHFDMTTFDRGEAILTVRAIGSGGVGPVTDTDPFFEHLHPMMQPQSVVSADGSVAGGGSGEGAGATVVALAFVSSLGPTNTERRSAQ